MVDTAANGAARTLLLNTAKVKLRDGARNKTLVKESYSPQLLLSADESSDSRFVLALSAKKVTGGGGEGRGWTEGCRSED